jgi:TP901 family phage tail tape measure protein
MLSSSQERVQSWETEAVATNLENLTVRIVVDSKGAEIGFINVAGRAQKLNGQFMKLDESMKVVTKDFKDLGNEAKAAIGKFDQKKIQESSSSWSELSLTVKGFQDSLRSVAGPLLAVQATIALVREATQLLGAAFDSTVGSAIKLESQIARINTLLSEQEMATVDLSAALLDQQRRFGTGTEESAKAVYEAIASGATDAKGALQLLDTAQKLAIGGVTTLDNAVGGITNAMNAYGISASDAAKISDTLFLAAAGGKTDIEQLVKQLGDATGIAKTAGVSFEELAFATSAVTANGQPTAIAVTGVRAAIAELLTPSKQLKIALEGIGISSVETAIKQKGFVQVLREVSKAYGGNATALAALFDRVESLPAISALVNTEVGNAFDEMSKNADINMNKAVKITDEASKKILDTTEQQIKKAKGNFSAALTEIGKTFEGSVVPILNTLTSLTNSFRDSFELIRESAKSLLPLATGDFAKVADNFKNIGDRLSAFKIKTVDKEDFRDIYTVKEELKKLEEAKKKAAEEEVIGAADKLEVQKFGTDLNNLEKQIKDYQTKTRSVGKDAVASFDEQRMAAIASVGEIERVAIKSKLVSEKFGDGLKKVFADARASATAYFTALKNDEAKKTFESISKEVEKISMEQMKGSASAEAAADLSLQSRLKEIDALEKQYQSLIKINPAIKGQLDALRQVAMQEAERAKLATQGISETQQGQLNTLLDDAYGAMDGINKLGMTQSDIIKEQTRARLADADALIASLELQKTQTKDAQKLLELEGAISNARSARGDIKTAGDSAARDAKAAGGGVLETPAKAVSDAIGSGSSVGGFMTAAEAIVGAIQKLIDFIPNIINAVTKIFTSLAELPNAIFKAVEGLISGIGTFISTFIPSLLQRIPDIIDTVLTAAFETLPAAAQKLFESLPELIQKFSDRVPELAEKFVKGLVSNSAVIAIGLVHALVGLMPLLFSPKLGVSLGIAISKAVIKGIVEGVKAIGASLTNLFKGIGPQFGASLSTGIQQGIDAVTEKVTGVSSQLFGLTDEPTQGATDKAKELVEQIAAAGRGAFEWLMKAWEAIKSVWRDYVFPFVKLLILDPLKAVWDVALAAFGLVVALFKSAWQLGVDAFNAALSLFSLIWEGVKVGFEAIWNVGKAMFDAVIGTFQALWEFAKGVFTNPIEAFNGLITGLSNVFGSLGTKILEAFQPVMNFFTGAFSAVGNIGSDLLGSASQFGSKVLEAMGNFGEKIALPIKDILKKVINPVIGVLNGLKLPAFEFKLKTPPGFKDINVTIWDSFDLIPGTIPKLNQGGKVPGSGFTDNQPALLTPGEFVMSRNAVAGIGLDNLERMNRGQAVGGNTANVSVNLTVNTEQPIDDRYIRAKIVPTLLEEVRRESLRGAFVLSGRGIK